MNDTQDPSSAAPADNNSAGAGTSIGASGAPSAAPQAASSLHARHEGWSGRFSEPVADFVLRYTASVGFDQRLAQADIDG